VLNELRYPNPGGEGRFKVRDFQFFLSNIRLTGGTGVYTEPDSYHLVRFDGAEPAFGIVLHDVPRRNYQRIEFGIGVDAAANKSLAQRGDLNPNGRMAWNWEVGYKIVIQNFPSGYSEWPLAGSVRTVCWWRSDCHAEPNTRREDTQYARSSGTAHDKDA